MRARNLKPGTFKNELLAVADPIYTLIFQGLWCLSDREGRLEDRPGKIHIEINPGRAFETTERALAWLSENGFIVRYEIGGVRCIWVVEFSKHQNPHQKEPPSKLPPYQQKPVPTPDKPGASPVQEQSEHESGPASSLNPDSGFLTPESPSLIPDPPFTAARGGQQTVRKVSEIEARARMKTIREAYPAVSGRVDWLTAEHHLRVHIGEGETWESMEAAVRRYAAWCLATSKIGTQFVLAPQKFFSAADRPWLQPWDLPEPPTETPGNGSNAPRKTRYEQLYGSGG